jgi:hypothetical protein
MSDDFAPGWQPEIDVPLEGNITAISEREGRYGPYKIYTIENDGEEVAVHAFHSVLANELEAVEVGNQVEITYLGKRPTKSGDKTFHAYRVDAPS